MQCNEGVGAALCYHRGPIPVLGYAGSSRREAAGRSAGESTHMKALSSKLMHSGYLSEEDVARLSGLESSTREFPARYDLISHGDNPENVHLVMEGVACRYKILPDGRRSIVALMLPGDFCDMHVAILRRMDHSIGTLTRCRVSVISRATLDTLLDDQRGIARAMWWSTLVDEAVLREWLVNLGKRQADKQLAHLYCEIQVRMKAAGVADDVLPLLTLEQLADALGISAVHAQRVQSALRKLGFISVQDRRVRIEDFEGLADYSEFDPDYLHLSNS
jgi:CRP-like cAMP-binding protein